MKKTLIYSSLLLTSLFSSDIDDIKKSMMLNYLKETQNINTHYTENIKLIEQNSIYYTNIVKKATEYYKNFIGDSWGEENVRLSSIKSFTQYSKDMNSRENIDFEKGKVQVEILVKPDEKIDVEVFKQKIKQIQEETISTMEKKDPVISLSNKYLEKKNIIKKEEKIETKKDTFLKDLITYVKLKKEDIKEKFIELKNGEKKKIVSVEIDMVPDHLKTRAIKFKDTVIKYSKKYDLKPSHVFSTIQTESYFNPLARSPIPAYGLMQIVPSTAGVDAYYGLTGKKVLLSSSYLYDSDKNIELGTKYIQIIRNNYLRGIKNETSLFYCASTSYNAGIGSLIKSFTGSYKKRKEAIDKINSMTSEEVYNHLRNSKFLTNEAKNYVKKLKDNNKNYLQWNI